MDQDVTLQEVPHETPTMQRRGERLARLRRLAERHGTVRLGEAAQALGVSAMTLRRDLAGTQTGIDLLGGHVVLQSPASPAYTLAAEQASHLQAKRQAGRHAAALVEPGDTVFIDCGTTMPHLVASLPTTLDITIVCYALNIAALVCGLPRAQVFLLGGLFHPASATFASDEALHSLQRFAITKAFLSAGGLHETQGATCSNFSEVPVKRAVLARALHSVLVIDRSKHGRIKPAQFASADAFHRIITEAG